MMGTALSLSPMDNVRMFYMMNKYVVQLMQAGRFSAIHLNITCPLTILLCKLLFGFRTLKEFPANCYVDKTGERPFKNVDDNVIQCIQIYENKALYN